MEPHESTTKVSLRLLGFHPLTLLFFVDVDGAIEAYKMAIKYDPNHLEAIENLAFAYFEKGDSDKQAIILYQKLTEARPTDPDSHSTLAVLYHRCGEHGKAAYALLTARKSLSDAKFCRTVTIAKLPLS